MFNFIAFRIIHIPLLQFLTIVGLPHLFNEFPTSYVLWEEMTENPSNLDKVKYTIYLYGYPPGRRFITPEQFGRTFSGCWGVVALNVNVKFVPGRYGSQGKRRREKILETLIIKTKNCLWAIMVSTQGLPFELKNYYVFS
jgi:hypothetical protein